MARNILITGSSHGIGAGCAVAFARDEGANVGITCNKNPAGAEAVAAECAKYGVKTKIYAGDVGRHDHCKAMVEDFVATFGKIDVLVNNAGGALQIPGGPEGEFKDMPMEYWDSRLPGGGRQRRPMTDIADWPVSVYNLRRKNRERKETGKWHVTS